VRSSRFSTMTRLPPGNGTEYPLTPCLDARKNPRLRETLESKSLRASEIVGCIGCSALGPLGVASAIRAHRRSRAGQNQGVKPFSPHGPAFLSGRLHMFRLKY